MLVQRSTTYIPIYCAHQEQRYNQGALYDWAGKFPSRSWAAKREGCSDKLAYYNVYSVFR
jgi:hypothetical protein